MTFLWPWILGMTLAAPRPVHPVSPKAAAFPAASTLKTPVETLNDTLREIVVLWHRDVPPAARKQALQGLGQVVREGRFAPLTVLRPAPGRSVDRILDLLKHDPRVRAADRNYRRALAWVPNDPLFPYQWGLQTGVLNMPAAWDQIPSGGDSTVKVGILDSGIAYEDFPIPGYEQDEVASADGQYHRAPDLAETRFAGGYDAVHQDFHANDQHGHGTHVAGTVAQSTNNGYGTAGVAFGVTLVPIQVASADGLVADDWVVDGIAYALQESVAVLNMSFGAADSSSVMHAALREADSAGVLLVAAAGNSGSPSVWYPAAYPEVLAVGAVRQNLERAEYSNYGEALDLVAPGGHWADSLPGILQQTYAPVNDSVVHVDTFAFVYKVGTSMAAPHVAGVAALLISVGASADQAREALRATARDLGTPGLDPEYGYGLVDAAAALAYVLGDSGTTSTLDTLRNPYDGDMVYTDDPQFQVVYQATRLRPQAPCSLLTLRFAFYNYDTLQARTKACSLFVWQDNAGQPGDPLLALVDSIRLGPDSMGYLEVPVETLGLTLEVPFWVGHLEITGGPPTAVLDDQAQGTNLYRFPGDPTWYQGAYDYYQEAVVRYYALNDSVPPEFQVQILPNPYLPRNLDIWVVSSEPLAGGDEPPESAAVFTPDSVVYPLTFTDIDRQTYKADFVVVDTGVLTLWIKGRDPAGNWSEVTLEFSTAFAGPRPVRLRSPDGHLQVEIPSQSEERVVVCVQRPARSFSLRGFVQGPVTYRYRTPVPLQPWIVENGAALRVEHFIYQNGEVRFQLPGLRSVVFTDLNTPVVLFERNPARPGDLLQVLGATSKTRAVAFFGADGRRRGTLPLVPGQPLRLPADLPSGVYFLKAVPDGRYLQRVVVVR